MHNRLTDQKTIATLRNTTMVFVSRLPFSIRYQFVSCMQSTFLTWKFFIDRVFFFCCRPEPKEHIAANRKVQRQFRVKTRINPPRTKQDQNRVSENRNGRLPGFVSFFISNIIGVCPIKNIAFPCCGEA